MQTVKVKVAGQYYWQDGRTKQISNYETSVQVPVNELHAPLRFIQKELINPTLAKKNEKSTGFRTCAIVGEVPVPPAGSYQPPEPDELTDLKAESFDDQGPVPAAEGAIIDEPDAKPTKRERVKAGK